jgi:hypothetical protein
MNAYSAFVQAHSNFDDSFIKKKEKVVKEKNDPSLDAFIEEDPTNE